MNEQDKKTLKDICDIVDKFLKLQRQIENPTRQGMMEALNDAQSIALWEVRATEIQQGDTIWTTWEQITDFDLYRKLSQYQLALRNHAINLAGEKFFNKILEWWNKIKQNISLTSVGRAIAHTNAKRYDSVLPDLD